jgi:non-heme Fe2+,alpha-ketoglutarate-dependent halogenase
MPKTLSSEAIERFRRDGFLCPMPILGTDEVAARRGRLEAFENAQGRPIEAGQRSKSHLLFKWLDDLIRDPRILDPVEDLVGPDILCWNTVFRIKEARSPSFVSWHQDLNYWGLETDVLVSAWLALSPAGVEQGCMRVLPGSHERPALPHADTFHADNMLTRGQEITVEVDEAKAVAMALEPGQMSLHRGRLAHASGPNASADRRIGISMHYIPTRARQTLAAWDSAALVRGTDAYGHFEHTPVPARDLDPAAVAFHARATRAVRDILFQGAAQVNARIG